jgi:ABC-2 type transport system ATP-binding protein
MRIEFQNISKQFSSGKEVRNVINNVSWSAEPGEIFGLLGPNGAGKTTMLRILLNILSADSGVVCVDDGKLTPSMEKFRHLVGYLPEERALYKSTKVRDTIIYFGILKGLTSKDAAKKADHLIKVLDLEAYAKSKNIELSKGLGQRVQLASCMIHDPKLLILDEPFYGLDPVNTQVVRDMLLQKRSEGATILLCTHQMKDVEALCDRIVMIFGGKVALFGEVGKIRERYSNNEVLLDKASQPEGLPSVAEITLTNFGKRVRLNPNCGIHDLITELGQAKRAVQKIEKAFTPLDEIFVSIVKGNSNEYQQNN